MTLLRKALWPSAIAVAFLLVLGAMGNVQPAYAAVTDVDIVDPGNAAGVDCDDDTISNTEALDERIFYLYGVSNGNISANAEESDGDDLYSIIQIAVEEDIWFCVDVDVDDDVTIDSDGYGEFTEVLCSDEVAGAGTWEDSADRCVGVDGIGSDSVHVDADTAVSLLTSGILVNFECENDAGSAIITVESFDVEFIFVIMCKDDATSGNVTVTAIPTTIEVVPAPGNAGHSLIWVKLEDASGGPVMPDTEVQATVDRCAIEEGGIDTFAEVLEARGSSVTSTGGYVGNISAKWKEWHEFANRVEPDTSPLSEIFTASSVYGATDTGWLGRPTNNPSTEPGVLEVGAVSSTATDDNLPVESWAFFIVHADLGGSGHSGSCAPGKVTVTVIVGVDGGTDIVKTVEITVVGPPASITVAASPSTIRCGEKATITATIKDAIGQNVSDHTQVEMITNLGGVLAGTGAVVSLAGPVVPISSTVAETFAGVTTAFLLTSDSHGGPYEVVVTAGGNSIGLGTGGLFSTAPISAQVTVNCANPVAAAPAQPTVTAPRTGDLGPVGGTIRPPSTGDGGLADSSGSSWSLFLIGGVAAFTLAGLASLKFARR